MTIPLILASSSPRRLSLMKDIGVVPENIVPAEIDETPKPKELPQDLARRLALEKLQAVAKNFPNKIILAADTVVAVGRRILPKAENVDDVHACLKLMSGRRHHVYTGVAIHGPGSKIRQRVVDSIVTFKTLTPQEIDAYVASGEGIGKAGGYAIQGQAASYIRFISGSYSNIVGLPLFEVAQLLKSCGFP